MAQPVKWKIAGDEVVSCNCAWGCPCQFNALPTHGRCEALMGCRVRDGFFGTSVLNGVVFACVLWWPGPMHQGNGTVQLIIDDAASQAQREALIALHRGKQGCIYFEILAALCPTMLEPIFAPSAFEYDREGRRGRIAIPGVLESRIEPIRNPVTGAEHRARIVLPEGFEFKEAEAANAAALEVTAPKQVAMTHRNTYAHLATVEWNN